MYVVMTVEETELLAAGQSSKQQKGTDGQSESWQQSSKEMHVVRSCAHGLACIGTECIIQNSKEKMIGKEVRVKCAAT
jgi:hypothetical protein